MRKISLALFSICIMLGVSAQKKVLDHTVYDGWQSIGERVISNNGQWVIYTVTPQEGDNELVIQSTDARYKKTIARGYSAVISEDSRFAVFKIKPLFKDTRDARIKKKRPDDMPKDSLAVIELGKDSVWKIARVKNYKTPEKESGWVAYQMEKALAKESARKAETTDKRVTDSLNRIIDSLQKLIAEKPAKKSRNRDEFTGEMELDAEGDDPPTASADMGTDLVVRSLVNGKERKFPNVVEYVASKKGNKIVFEQARDPKDSTSRQSVMLYDAATDQLKLLSKGANEFKLFAFSEDGSQVAYVAERDAKPKELQKYYKLWYYKSGMDSATMLADKNSVGMKLGMTISEYGNLSFSKSGRRLFFGTAPIQPPKDTTLVDIDLVKLDVWHYNDDYLQTQQLFRLNRDLQENFIAVFHLNEGTIKQLGSKEIPNIVLSNEGDGNQFFGITDYGKRVEAQWTANTKKDIYAINAMTGEKKLVKKDLLGTISANYVSPTGKYVMWYDSKAKHYFAWTGDSIRNISKKIKAPLWNEEHDSPSDPPPYGLMSWHENDSLVYIYDRYDIWAVDPVAKMQPRNLSVVGRTGKKSFRYLKLDNEERFVRTGQRLYLRNMDQKTKASGISELDLLPSNQLFTSLIYGDYALGNISKAKESSFLLYNKETYTASPDLYINPGKVEVQGSGSKAKRVENELKLSSLNPQQSNYYWGTSELYKWKAFDGKPAEGILYKPENFDPKKKYPVIFYFYETHTNTLHDYIDPTPTGSRLNISFFVSRGYLVFSPDIRYKVGYPAKSAYNYVVSAAKDLAKKPWVDGKNMGIQGQSWGGIQVAQLITMTDIFKAAWAGAPVANMTSAYGGIRWESGANRQFQYEKTQSRIGATLWQKPQLYIENSPLFHLPKVKTPLVIMANDADGAVPWYQGIELFTAMRRLGKKVWMLNYNGEAHNLVERKNKKDIQVREQQYFDWLLKGEKPPKWIVDGIPAVKKGRDWGLELID